jgi:tetratricopeptide (TPR) repeat protein
MNKSAQILLRAACMALACSATGVFADPQVIERATRLLADGNPRQAYMELVAIQAKSAGNVEYDYLLGVAALDSGKLEDAIIAFERVLAINPRHAGAQMDLARAYYATGSFDLAEAGFLKLKENNPPPAAAAAIDRYLVAIAERKRQVRGGGSGYGELGLGYDSNITGVPSDFGAAASQSFGIAGISPTGNAVKRDAPFAYGALGGEYSYPLQGSLSLFTGGDLRGRAYQGESDFNLVQADGWLGVSLDSGPSQWRLSAGYLYFDQQGAAPGDPQPTNERRDANAALNWRYNVDAQTQWGMGLQYHQVRFPTNSIEDFNQVFLSATYLKSFAGPGAPMVLATVFYAQDEAQNKLPDNLTDKSKDLAGLRLYSQYSVNAKVLAFGSLGFVYRKDKDDYARATAVANGRDKFGEASVGILWQFQPRCAVRAQYAYTRNDSNIDIYSYNRSEVITAVRCDIH